MSNRLVLEEYKPGEVPTMTNYKEITLEKFKVASQMQVSQTFLSSLKLSRAEDFMTEELIFRLVGSILGRQVMTNTEQVAAPASWWDHVKHSLFPQWLQRRFPARMTMITVSTTHNHLCPHLELGVIEPGSRHIKFLTEPYHSPINQQE